MKRPRRTLSGLLLAMLLTTSLVVPTLLEAASPLSILQGHTVKPAAGTTEAGAPAAETPTARQARIFLNTDGLVSRSKDLAFMQLFKAELEKRGIPTQISPYGSGPNNHVLSIKNCPQGSWVVTAASGICAGTFRDMVLARKGYLKSSWEKNQIAGLIFLNLSPHLLKGLGYLRRAWDDNFSPASFRGIENPYQYIRSVGYFVAESASYNKPELNPKRVPILAAQIADIVLGRSEGGTESAEAQELSWILQRVAQGDTSQDGAKVKELQRALQACGYYRGYLVDGWFGPLTQQAVMAFQRDHRLNVSGYVGPSLFSYIRDKAREGKGKPATGTSGSSTTGGSFACPDDLKSYLQATSHCQVTNAAIQAKARSLRGSTPAATIANVFRFAQSLGYRYYYNSQQGAATTLARGRGNCCDQANLIVALLRANGIPGKYGHCTDCRFGSGLRCGHVWAYAWCDGKWLALDSTSSKNRVGALNSFTALGTIRTYRELSF
ncbi:MAG: hypothetical protein GX442_08400 [Candidatus Riflebacteria bacterium]|nr:hypothetical protein [Candidatus Riflebacteria bacterium]